MFEFIAILFILFVTFFIGEYVGKLVPDELAYMDYAILTAFLVMLGALFLGLGLWLAFLVPLLVLVRKWLLYAPLSGVVIGASLWVPSQFQGIILVCALVLNFLLGTQKNVWRDALWQAGLVLVFIITRNV